MSALPNLTLISVDEYLNTQYGPDVEYVDGLLVDRKMGDWLHSLVQSNILFALRNRFPHFKTVAELRSRISNTKYRLPDVSLLRLKAMYAYRPPMLIEVEGDVISTVDGAIAIPRSKVFAD